ATSTTCLPVSRHKSMQLDAAVLLYGAGREARSTLGFLQARVPELKIYVTADTGTPDLPGTTFLPPADLPAALSAGKFATIVKSPGVSGYAPFFDAARQAGIPITSNLNLWGAAYRTGRIVVAIT